MNKEFEKIIEKLEEYKYENLVERNSEEMQHCKQEGDCGMMDCTLCVFDKAIEIVKQEAEQYEECYKDCGDCEAYDKENHHCPKFCKVITEAVKEIEENHNGWIPCNERLPSKEEFLEAYCRNKYGAEFIVMIEGANKPTTLYLTSDGFWVDDCRNVHEVTAWQPLPPEYQPKGE